MLSKYNPVMLDPDAPVFTTNAFPGFPELYEGADECKLITASFVDEIMFTGLLIFIACCLSMSPWKSSVSPSLIVSDRLYPAPLNISSTLSLFTMCVAAPFVTTSFLTSFFVISLLSPVSLTVSFTLSDIMFCELTLESSMTVSLLTSVASIAEIVNNIINTVVNKNNFLIFLFIKPSKLSYLFKYKNIFDIFLSFKNNLNIFLYFNK